MGFNTVDWLVVFGYLALTTWIGHAMRGKQGTIKDFFLGGRSLPWIAVCGSIIATEISALTFIGVPAIVYAEGGDMRYLQWAIGSIIARFIVGIYFIRLFYKKQIFSPYDFMGNVLGEHARRTTTILFWIGGILGQSVRVMVTAIILRAVTGIDANLCILLVGVFAVFWTLMGGMRTVIWTDVVQFIIFLVGGILSLVVLISAAGGWGTFTDIAGQAGKLRVIDTSFSLTDQYILLVAIFAIPFQNVTAYGLDQLMAQRAFCCRDANEAGKAVMWSSVSQVITLIMLLVGAGLYVFYKTNVMPDEMAERVAGERNLIFPLWILDNLPVGVRGLIIAGAFAAAISSLDSILAALSQTSISLFTKQEVIDADKGRLVFLSRMVVVGWGIALTAFTMILYITARDTDLISLAFGMLAYTYGPLLGIFMLAVLGKRRSPGGILLGVGLSILFTLWTQEHLYQLLGWAFDMSAETAATIRPDISWAWMFPISFLITFACGYFFSKELPDPVDG